MPPEYVHLFITEPWTVDAWLGEYDDDPVPTTTAKLLSQLEADPNVRAVLAARSS